MSLKELKLNPATFSFGQYQELAGATESPVDNDCVQRFKDHLPILLYVLRNPSFIPNIFDVCDDLKKRIFYGKDVPLRVSEQVAKFMEPTATWDDIDSWWWNTNVKHRIEIIRLFHAVIGMISECGELVDALVTPQGGLSDEMVDTINIGEELADGQWYTALACRAVHSLATLPNFCRPRSTNGFDQLKPFMGVIAINNLLKLEQRHGIDFSASRVMDRNLPAERQVLEGKVGDDGTFTATSSDRTTVDPAAG